MNEFQNPYGHFPAPTPKKCELLGQDRPVGHHRWSEAHYSGVIDFEIDVASPLLAPEATPVSVEDGHKTYRTRRDPRALERPLLPASSFKGAFRSYFEAATNSRMGVLEPHDRPLGLRMEARTAIGMVPARIAADEGRLEVELLAGPHQGRRGDGWAPAYRNGRPDRQPGNELYAAWIHYYPRGERQDWEIGVHRTKVAARLQKARHTRRGFLVWVCVDKADSQDGLAALTNARDFARGERMGNLEFEDPSDSTNIKQVFAYICATNQNIRNKHDERLFFADSEIRIVRPLTDDLVRRWRNLVLDYQEVHADDLQTRKDEGKAPWLYLGDEPGKTAWSRHVYTRGCEELKDGDLCYALCGPKGEIQGLYPVQISRELFDAAPIDLLPNDLRPATKLSELSPADRIFGWANQDGAGAYRGQLRFEPFDSSGARIEQVRGGGSLPLAILGQPKPAQTGFYLAMDKSGAAPNDGQGPTRKVSTSYKRHHGWRGRKAFAHHRLACETQGYWDLEAALADSQRMVGPDQVDSAGRQETGVFREYVRRRGADSKTRNNRDKQNRSIVDWIAPGSKFRGRLRFDNANAAEIGALIWLLSLNHDLPEDAPKRHLRLGGGKPLGFGSVVVSITGGSIESGEDRKQRLLAFDDPAEGGRNPADGAVRDEFVGAYRRDLEQAYGAPFEEISFIDALLAAAEGDAARPVHYPRMTAGPHPAGENFRWFVENARGGRPQALPQLRRRDMGGLKRSG